MSGDDVTGNATEEIRTEGGLNRSVHPPPARISSARVRDVGTARRYLTLPAVRPPTRRFSMSMKRTTTGMIATTETPNT